ncbi:hypothetical protein M0802_015798 [Mischocyttarus mexicanus]|nr:hypothetical protein M0802_015798 [Mischocyttarus mexicanus]
MDEAEQNLCRCIKKFNYKSMNILVWLNEFDYLIDVFQIPNDRKVYMLLNMIESVTLIELKTKLDLNDISYFSYDLITTKLEKIFSLRDKQFGSYLRFLLRNQYDTEDVGHYSAALIKLINNSNIQKKNNYLVSRFVKGVTDVCAQRILNYIPGLKFKNAVNIARLLEIYKKIPRINSLC